jgi:hypothetical protein
MKFKFALELAYRIKDVDLIVTLTNGLFFGRIFEVVTCFETFSFR